jgi:hypothetical protein
VKYLRGFIPWIAFAVISPDGWRWGALAGLLTGLVLLQAQRRKGVAADALILEISTVVYFAALTALAFAAPGSPLHHYSGVLSLGWLALTAWGTLAVRRPFTLGIARQNTPPEYWNRPRFLRTNVVITTVWAAAFTLTAAAIAICDVTAAGSAASLACQVAGFAAPAIFTARYPKIVQARYAS